MRTTTIVSYDEVIAPYRLIFMYGRSKKMLTFCNHNYGVIACSIYA